MLSVSLYKQAPIETGFNERNLGFEGNPCYDPTFHCYNNLKNNKPTIIGAKKNDGSMHFVIVKGFSGGNALTKANFIINDPGSNTRTTLNEFMNVYPNFYKIAYYK